MAGCLTCETSAQERPKDEDFNSIIEQLTSHHREGSKVEFVDHDSSIPACGMQPANMTVSRDSDSKSFPVMVDRRRGRVKQIFAKLGRISVDADGAGRAYHPDDPFGEGTCDPSAKEPQDICALDNIANAGMRLFQGSIRLKTSSTAPDRETFLLNWRELWPLIRDQKLVPLPLSTVVGPDGPRDYNLFHWPERNLTFAFNTNIVPATKKGYPCRYDRRSESAGYFLSATTLKNGRHGKARECEPHLFIDSETVPFFVIPKETLEGIELGDIAIGLLTTANDTRIVYGIAGDAGPFDHFGEGSIAFNKTLLRNEQPVESAKDVDALDIDLSAPDRFHDANASLGVLLLGGTRKLLGGDFSASNIKGVGEAQLKRWNRESALGQRRKACLDGAP